MFNLGFTMTDKELIEKLGGVAALSKHLSLSYQCVFNWTKRGIPAQVKVNHQDIFLAKNPKPIKQAKTA